MAILRTYPAGWALGDLLTTAQQNALDINVTNAADKRVAYSDTIGAIWQMAQPGRIVESTFIAPDTTSVLGIGDTFGTNMRITSGVTANRSYSLGNASTAVNGDSFTVWCDATFNFEASIYDNASSVLLYVIGNKSTSDGTWAEFFFNGTAWVLTRDGHGTRLQLQDFTAYGQIVVPRGVYLMMVNSWGGGGGGGCGMVGANIAAAMAIAGPGGAGSQGAIVIVPVTPGATLEVLVGTGGPGAPLAGQFGSDGTDTIVQTLGGGTVLNRARGAAAAWSPTGIGYADNTAFIVTAGASGVAGCFQNQGFKVSSTNGFPGLANTPGGGGPSGGRHNPGAIGDIFSQAGVASLQGYAGGAAGTNGSNSASTYAGGNGGGGGGGGPGGNGANGGNGGNANSAGLGVSGNVGASAAANTGAGGGGGGGAGAGTTGGINGGPGGAGGSGRAKLYWVK